MASATVSALGESQLNPEMAARDGEAEQPAERNVIVIQPQPDMEDGSPEESETPIMAAEIEIPTVVPVPVQEPPVQMNILGNTGILEIFDSCTINRRKPKIIMLCLLLASSWCHLCTLI